MNNKLRQLYTLPVLVLLLLLLLPGCSKKAEKQTESVEAEMQAGPAEAKSPAFEIEITSEVDLPTFEADRLDDIRGGAEVITQVNSRMEPNSEAKVYRVLEQQERVEITADAGNGWSEVLVDGQKAFVLSRFLFPDNYEPEGAMGIELGVHFGDKGWKSGSDRREVFYSGALPDALKMGIYNQPEGISGTVCYQIYKNNTGWLDESENLQETGTEPDQDSSDSSGFSAVRVWLNGELDGRYDIYAKALIGSEWTQWVRNGAVLGSENGSPIEGLCVTVNEAGSGYPASESITVPDPSKPMVALTFDDGPDAAVTDRILDALAKVNGRATFFILGVSLTGDNKLCTQRMKELGCEMGCHTYTHENLGKSGDAEIINAVTKGDYAIKCVSGFNPVIMRPPGGACYEEELDVLARINKPSILWSIDTLDWKTKNVDSTVNEVLNKVKDGDIVLMHDKYDTTAAAVEIIVPELVKRGYQLVTVSEMAAARGGLRAGHEYRHFYPK